jgi:hypothetical protein
MKILFLIGLVWVQGICSAQTTFKIEKEGAGLKAFYLSLDVENLWIAGSHINWETGIADKPEATAGNHTHCSAFAAAACKRLDIYLLRPPEHKQILLANAQYDWLQGKDALAAGWMAISGNSIYATAQTLANNGKVVLAICKNPDTVKPGHVALVMPADISSEKLNESGPVLIMAGLHNHNKVSLKAGFKSHLNGWPENTISFFVNSKQFKFQ